jgi:Domain of unknown function (DUF4124)
MQKIALPLVACLLAIAASGAHAQSLWKWRDASGQLHISDTAPPPGTPAKNIISSPAGAPVTLTTATSSTSTTTSTVATPPAASGAPAPETELEKRKKAAEKEKADRDALAQKNDAIRKDNCTRATNDAASIQSGVRIATTNAQGERGFLDDAQRAAELRRVQDIAAANCGPAPTGQ